MDMLLTRAEGERMHEEHKIVPYELLIRFLHEINAFINTKTSKHKTISNAAM